MIEDKYTESFHAEKIIGAPKGLTQPPPTDTEAETCKDTTACIEHSTHLLEQILSPSY